jgi:hypothetical protein
VNPDIRPQAIPDLWMKSAAKTAGGLVVDPAAFIEAVQKAAVATKAAT